MVDVKKYSDVDFYGLLAIDISASEAEVSVNRMIYLRSLNDRSCNNLA